MVVQENFGAIESFEQTATGVRMIFSKDGHRGSAEAAEAALAVVAVGLGGGCRRAKPGYSGR
jgi:hypothetical protein